MTWLQELVDLGGEDKIVLGEAADAVRGQLNGEPLVAGQVEIRMVIFGLGDGRDALDQIDRLEKPFARDHLAEGCAPDQFPSVEIRQELLGGAGRQRVGTAFARLAFPLGQGGIAHFGRPTLMTLYGTTALGRVSVNVAPFLLFRLGLYLRQTGSGDEGAAALDEASRLHPDSWNIWRQAAETLDNGLAAGPDFWARVEALGEKHYYRPVDMEGMPTDGPPLA